MILGIDPGVSGALAVLHDDGTLADVWDMPTVGVMVGRTKRNRISAPVLASQIALWGRKAGRLCAIVEAVQPMPRDGCVQSFGLGYSKGTIEGVLAALSVPYGMATPAVWKRAMGLPADKGAARLMAQRTWPSRAEDFARVKDDGRAEAALLALYAQRAQRSAAA